MKPRHVVSALVAALLISAGSASAQQSRVVSLDDCIATALEHNPDAKSADLEIDAANATRSGIKGEFLPKIHIDANVTEWNSEFDLPFGATVFNVRDAFTWGATATLTQPLSGLFYLYDRYQVEKFGVDVAQIRRDVARRDLAFSVAESYLRLLEAKRLGDVAKTSVTQLEAQQKQAQSLFTNGVIGKNDMLRASLALASAKQREIAARGQVLLLRGRLATLMGISSDAPIEPVAFAGDAPPTDESSLEGAETKAASQRLEVREVVKRISQSDARVGAAKWRLFPSINAVGSYMHNEGSAFQQKDAAFIGVVGSWDIWDWGATSSAVDEASARREQAKLAKVKLEDDVRLEARQAFVNADTAKEALAVARTAVEQAEENYRIVTKRFEQSAGTSFDVVDAEALLTTSRAQVEDAFYGYLVARISLQRATGAMTPRVR